MSSVSTHGHFPQHSETACVLVIYKQAKQLVLTCRNTMLCVSDVGLYVKPTKRLKLPSLHALGGSSLALTHCTRVKAAMTGFAFAQELFLELPHFFSS